jgi:hypothetical protein
VARDVADRNRNAAALQHDHVVPVAADARIRFRREVASGHRVAGHERERGGEQAALERLDDPALVLVAARVANGEGSPVGEQAEERDLL